MGNMNYAKLFLLILILLGSRLCLAPVATSTHPKGWEIGGGDMMALKFVKAGRVFLSEIEQNPSCQLAKYFAGPELRQALDRTKVETSDQDTNFDPAQIVVNRNIWMFLSREDKLEAVLRSYARVTHSALPAHLTRSSLESCLVSHNWMKVFNSGGNESVPALDVKKDIYRLQAVLMSQLKSNPNWSVRKYFAISQLDQAVRQAKLAVVPSAFQWPDHIVKDGLNLRTEQTHDIVVQSYFWRHFSVGQREELLMHELLGLAEIRDDHYQISSHLFLDLPKKDYEL